MKFTLFVPTYNAGLLWEKWIASCQKQTLKPTKTIVIDSCSTDSTIKLAEKAGFFIHKISKSDFNHGATRNLAVQFSDVNTEILVFMTQDALLATSSSLEELLKPFEDPKVAAVYGRQLPHKNANPLAAHTRLFNYPLQSRVKSRDDIAELGIKVAFMANSFAAYRKSIFEEIGGFPKNTILAEDMYLAAKMIQADYKVAYCAEACVYHSHNYSLMEEFKRYFDIGVFQQKQYWIQQNFGKVGNEGKKFVFSEFKYLLKHNPLWIPLAILSTLFKLIGFKLGLQWNKLPIWLIKKLSMHKGYWN